MKWKIKFQQNVLFERNYWNYDDIFPICLSTQKLIYCKKAYQNIASSVQPLC